MTFNEPRRGPPVTFPASYDIRAAEDDDRWTDGATDRCASERAVVADREWLV